MKKTYVILSIIALLTMTLISADSANTRVGERLFLPLGEGVIYWPADSAFHIAHGWYADIPGPTFTVARGDVRLVIDGEDVEEDFVEYIKTTEINEQGEEVTYLYKYFVFNFPDGMEGTHIFVMYYANICYIMEEMGLVDFCEFPNQVVESTYPDKIWEIIFESAP